MSTPTEVLSAAGASIDQALTEIGRNAGISSEAAASAASSLAQVRDLISAIPSAPPVPDVTQTEFDELVAKFGSISDQVFRSSADIVALSDLVNRQEAADTIEDAKQSADILALAARIGSGPGQSLGLNPNNDIILDTFPGTDDDRLTAALTVAAASSPRRAIRLSARNYTFTKTRNTFSGLRILGPNEGWQNPEISGTGGALPQCSVTLNCGVGAQSWLVGTATTYNTMIAGICFKSSNGNTQFYHHPYSAGTCYAATMDSLTFYGFKHVLGTPADPFSMTLVTWKGEWTLVAVQDTQFSLRGSDNWLKPSSMNYGWAGNNGGKYLMRFSNLSKTGVANLYLTARGGSRAVLVEGPTSQQGGLDFSDCVFEGQNLNDPAMGALIVVTGGGVSFKNTKLNFGMARPTDFKDQTDTALVMVKGGIAAFDTVWTGKATATAADIPVFDVTGGICKVANVFGVQPLGAPVSGRYSTGATLLSDSTVRSYQKIS